MNYPKHVEYVFEGTERLKAFGERVRNLVAPHSSARLSSYNDMKYIGYAIQVDDKEHDDLLKALAAECGCSLARGAVVD